MPRLRLSNADFARLMTNLLPTGDAWADEPGSVQQQVLQALSPTLRRLNDRANALVDEAFPKSTSELLEQWEQSLGLPDPCVGTLTDPSQRRAMVVAKLIARGGQSISYFTAIAAALGAAITVEQFAPFRADSSYADDPCGGDEWASAWFVTVRSLSGETWADRSIECSLSRYAPAQTTVYFEYPLSGAAGLLDQVGVVGTSSQGFEQNIIGVIP